VICISRGKYSREDKYVQRLVGKAEDKRTPERPKLKWDGNIKKDFQDVEWRMGSIDVAPDREG
jgi:hypothetical protein